MEQTYSTLSPETDLFPDVQVVYAGFWERFAAAFLDGLILLVPIYAIKFLISEQASNFSGIVIGWLYAALQESGASQATLGKRALGIKVTNLDGQRVSFGQATGRHFGKYISMVILLIGYLMMLWNDKKQTLHDKMAGTLIVKGKV